MSILSRLLKPRGVSSAAMRPLWHATVAVAREKAWYAQHGVADTVPGRFDAVAMVLSLVLLRLEREGTCAEQTARLTELFVTDMDGQLRENGVGDLVVGKHIGKLMGVLGGRLGAYREALAQPGDEALAEAAARNMTLVPGADPRGLALALRTLAVDLAATPVDELLAGTIAR